ncbi:E3 ubiquitin-protein ligase ORTHRUS 2 [Bienertia sinuspersici]
MGCRKRMAFGLRCDNSPAPWTSDEHGDRPRRLPNVPELKEAMQLTERKESPHWDFDVEKGCWMWKKPPPPSKHSKRKKSGGARLKKNSKAKIMKVCEERNSGGRALRTRKTVMKCPFCTTDISEFPQNAQVNRELLGVIESLMRKFDDEEKVASDDSSGNLNENEESLSEGAEIST